MASRDIYPIGQQDFKILRENGAKRGPSRIGLSKKKGDRGWDKDKEALLIKNKAPY